MLYLLKPEILPGYAKQFEITSLYSVLAFLPSNQSVLAAVILLGRTSLECNFLPPREAGAATLVKTLSLVQNRAVMALCF